MTEIKHQILRLYEPLVKVINLNRWHNRPMIWSAGDLGIEIDFGPDQPGAILQRKEKGYWHNYLVDGEPGVNPFDEEYSSEVG